ncbi:hypothetical protein Tco_0107642, partial [Tanacetum coccineum]
GLNLTYASSTITSQKPTERELDILFEAMYDDYIVGQPLDAPRTAPAAPANQNIQTPTTSTTTTNSAPASTNSSIEAPTIPNTSQDVNTLQQQHFKQQDNQVQLQPKAVADNDNIAVFNENMFINPFAPSSTSPAESSSYDRRTLTTSIEKKSTMDRKRNVHLCIVCKHYGTINVKEAMTDMGRIDSLQDKLLQFKRLDV